MKQKLVAYYRQSATLRIRYEQRVQELELKKAETEAEHANAEAALEQLERGAESFQEWQKNLAGLKAAIAKDADSRIRLNAHLKEFITQIEVFATGHEDTVEHVEDIVWDQIPELAKSAGYKSFRKFLREGLLSADGRFFRLHYKPARTWQIATGEPPSSIQVAPAASLALKTEVRGKDWKLSTEAWPACR